ncbi:MAG: phosphoglycerate dehydrogenase [Acidimicrobiales bacterium]|nr:phosphoglycerate dehydrogenase [Acidimicrobiales bacterium]
MKILLADSLPEASVQRLEAAGDEVRVDATLGAEDLAGALAGIEVLVVRSTPVTEEALRAADQLALVVRAGAGTNTIDCDVAAELGIFVCNVPGKNALAVAELTLGLLLAVDRHIADATGDLRVGRWNKKAYSEADGLFGRTMGIIGLGDIGIATAERASAFGIDVIAEEKPERSADAVARALRAGVRFVADRDALLRESDIVSLHVPGGADTAGLVDAAFLATMKNDAILLNTSRGDVVDEAALIAAMDERGIRAGLDVFADEPGAGTGEFDSPLARHPSVVATHHIGASTEQAQNAVADGTVDAIDAYRRGGVVNCVNMEAAPPKAATLTIRHRDRVGVLAAVLTLLRRSELNVSNMSNKIFSGSKAAVATIDVGSVPSAALIEELRSQEHVINVAVTIA